MSRELLTDLLRAYVWSGRVNEAESLGKELLRAAGSKRDAEIVRLFLARSLLSQGRGPEGLSMLEPVLADEEIAGDTGTALASIGAALHVMVGDAEGARALGERGVRVARAAGRVGDEALNLAYLGMADRAAGNPRQGVELAAQAAASLGAMFGAWHAFGMAKSILALCSGMTAFADASFGRRNVVVAVEAAIPSGDGVPGALVECRSTFQLHVARVVLAT